MKRLDRKTLTLGLPTVGLILAVLGVLLLLGSEETERGFYEPGAGLSEERFDAPRVSFDSDAPLADEEVGPSPLAPADAVAAVDSQPPAPAAPSTKAEPKDARPGLLLGQVHDVSGVGVAAASVTVRARNRRQGGQQGARFDKTLLTDAMGQFTLEVPPGAYVVRAAKEGFARSGRARARVQPGANQTLEPLVLRPACALRGLVLTQDGRPLGGARVTVQRSGDDQETAADARGAFALGGLAEGLYTVSASKAGYVAQTERNIPVTEGGGGEVTFRLASGGVLTGVLRQGGGEVLARGLVFAFWRGQRLGMTRSDEEGRYRLSDLRPGPVELFARSEDYALTVRTTGSAAAGQLTVQDLVLVEGPRLEGVLTDPSGKPLAGLRVSAREKGGDVNRRSEPSGEDGRFLVKNLYPGRYELRVGQGRAWGASRVTLEVEVVAGLFEQNITVPYGSGISGVVRDDTGKLLAQANVFAIVGRDYRGATRSNEKGEFRFEGLPADTYQLFVRVGDDRQVGLREVVLNEGATLDGVELIARAPARLRGRVLDPQGRGLAGVEINVRGGSSPVQRRATTGADGSFEIGPLYDGDYELAAAEGPLLLLARKWAVDQVRVEGFRFQVRGGQDLQRDLQVQVSN